MDCGGRKGKECNCDRDMCDRWLGQDSRITYVDKAGKRTPVEINATVVETEGRETILALCRDISGRKLAEERLKRAL